jgi:hypothetical protein
MGINGAQTEHMLMLGLVNHWKDGAGDGTRTRDVQLGKLAFYRLNYSRSTNIINIAQSVAYTPMENCPA